MNWLVWWSCSGWMGFDCYFSGSSELHTEVEELFEIVTGAD